MTSVQEWKVMGMVRWLAERYVWPAELLSPDDADEEIDLHRLVMLRDMIADNSDVV